MECQVVPGSYASSAALVLVKLGSIAANNMHYRTTAFFVLAKMALKFGTLTKEHIK
jgi:hypothetical protein